MAAMAPEKSRTLHNFSLPSQLTWGSHKLLRCTNLNNDNDVVSHPPPPERRKRRYHHHNHQNASFRPGPSSSIRRPESLSSGDDQIEAIREKLILDLRSEVDKMRAAFLGSSAHLASSPPAPAPPPVEEPAAELRPWNLRTRRAACKEPVGDSKSSASEQTANTKAPPPARGGDGEREKFSVALSKQEIEDDFVKMIGKRPPRKPKKRPRYVQRQLDTLFPGLWLSEITPDMYTVDENPELGK